MYENVYFMWLWENKLSGKVTQALLSLKLYLNAQVVHLKREKDILQNKSRSNRMYSLQIGFGHRQDILSSQYDDHFCDKVLKTYFK